MLKFDKSVAEILVKEVKNKTTVKVSINAPISRSYVSFFYLFLHCSPLTRIQGHLHNYRLVEDVWTFDVQNASFKMDGNQVVTVPKVRIVSCKNADAPDTK